MSAEFTQGVYATDARQQAATWLQQQTHGVTVFITLDEGNKAFRECEMRVSDAVAVLLPPEDRQHIQTGLMEFYFRSSPIPTDAYTSGLLAGIEAMEKKILGSKENEVEKLPGDVVTITHLDKEFAAGIDDDKLKIEYAIKEEFVGTLKAAKLEVYKDLAEEPCFVTSLNTEETNTYLWDGKLSEEEGDYITYKDSPFTVKITVSEDEDFKKVGVVENEGWVDKEADEFRLYKDFTQKHIGSNRRLTPYQYYREIRPQIEDIIISRNPKLLQLSYNDNPLKYYTEKIVDTKFIGRTFKAHTSYQPILERIEDTMGKPDGANYNKYKNNKRYSIGGFVIRFQNDVDKISDHSFGMAIDIDAVYNPQLRKKELGFVSLLSNYNIVWQKGSKALTVEDMKKASDHIKSLNITENSLSQMQASFLAIDLYNQIENVYKLQDLTAGSVTKSFVARASAFTKLYQRASYLSNERHFLENPLRYSQEEASVLEKEFYEDIPKRCKMMQEELVLFKNKINPLHKIFKNHYNSAFFLDKNFEQQYSYVDNYLEDIVKSTQKMIEALSRLNELINSKKIPSCFSCEVPEVKGSIVYNELSFADIRTFFERAIENNKYIYGTKQFKDFADWIRVNQSYLKDLSKRGFFRIENEFVHYFLDQKEITWGGFFRNRNDWMHFEINDKYKQF